MEQDLLTSLPQELMMDILSRLPIPNIIQSKLVCKPWLVLIESREFARFHLSKSVPGLALGHDDTKAYEFHEFVEDEVDYERSDAAFNFSLPYNAPILCSVNGLLFMHKDLFICNPITREYIVLPPPQSYSDSGKSKTTYGFGVSKISRQYKVVMISRDGDESSTQPPKYTCEVYTLGTGSWRSIVGCPSTIKYDRDDEAGAIFVNGNLHWRGSSRLGEDGGEDDDHICSPPSCNAARLTALEDCLCLFDNYFEYKEEIDEIYEDFVNPDEVIIIWLLKEYGDEKSWTNKLEHKVFKDGDILMSSEIFYWGYHTSKLIYTPTFLSLKTFAMEENVSLY